MVWLMIWLMIWSSKPRRCHFIYECDSFRDLPRSSALLSWFCIKLSQLIIQFALNELILVYHTTREGETMKEAAISVKSKIVIYIKDTISKRWLKRKWCISHELSPFPIYRVAVLSFFIFAPHVFLCFLDSLTYLEMSVLKCHSDFTATIETRPLKK